MQVLEATKRLRNEMMVERVLIDGAMEMAEIHLRTDKERSAMSPAHRALFDEAKLKYEKLFRGKNSSSDHEVPDYRRPDFTMPDGAYDDAMVSAIRDKISSLKQERDDYIAAANKKCLDPRLRAYLQQEFERLGGPETAKTLKKTTPNDVPIGRTEREKATTGTKEPGQKLRKSFPATHNFSAPWKQTFLSVSDLFGFEPQNESIKARAQAISVPYLLHFTQVENLPSIMAKGLCPVATLTAAATPFRANDCLRLDGHKDAVSLSIAHPNDRMFAKYRWQALQQKWAVLVLDSSILWQYPTAFNRRNAADKRISSLSRAERMTVEAFDAMFMAADDLPSREANSLFPFDPTDVQAELLVFDKIPSFKVNGVVFGDADSLNSCEASIGTQLLGSLVIGERRLSIHSEGRGFFGARAYARKSGWTY